MEKVWKNIFECLCKAKLDLMVSVIMERKVLQNNHLIKKEKWHDISVINHIGILSNHKY